MPDKDLKVRLVVAAEELVKSLRSIEETLKKIEAKLEQAPGHV